MKMKITENNNNNNDDCKKFVLLSFARIENVLSILILFKIFN